ncbi:uncharacterized protein PV09_07906 [Verruconis gallopava]|uniref:F-box domain-containing protein n=1 Tax=Verruconis gallopava TaxID=253628 RepID=A0A0D1XEF9_9PEZI|nr:uncharacterized protein PV09_07906 [Verruconis gallopava]KIW00551.1 hypothetical protein PV09_07906 [Verruconis gallopava]
MGHLEHTMQPFRFMDLPAELRDQIYTHLLNPEDNCTIGEDGIIAKYNYDLRFFRTCKQVYAEAKRMLQVLPWNTFARIETPWEEAQEHVRVEGMVPILMTGKAAETFSQVHVRIVIDAPFHQQDENENKKFIVFVHDLDRFTKMWMYSDLSYAGDLNPHLRLRLYLRNPSVPDGDDYVKMTKKLQRKILLPFGNVKNLRDTKVISEDPGITVDKDIEDEMRKRMLTPYKSAEQCLGESKKLMEEGDKFCEAVEGDSNGKGNATPDYHAAIEKYIESFAAMHIVCIKRRRSIWGDAWFDRFLTSGAFRGKHGQIVRLCLRVELVSKITNAYVRLGMASDQPKRLEYLSEAHFWGMRTINLLREHVNPHDAPHDNFPNDARRAMGMTYLRTGMAGMEMAKYVPLALDDAMRGTGDQSMRHASKRLLLAARRWCPNDDEVEKVLWSYGLS